MATASHHPDRKAQQRIQAGLGELKKWKRQLLTDLIHEADPANRADLGRRIDEVEQAVFLLEHLLHPMNGDER